MLSLKRAPQYSRAFSWPLALGLHKNDVSGLAFGWPARGSLQSAFDRAQQAGYDLSLVISQLNKIAPQRPIDIIAHSLGVRVAIAALELLAFDSVDRIIAIAGAEFYCTVMMLWKNRLAKVLNSSILQAVKTTCSTFCCEN